MTLMDFIEQYDNDNSVILLEGKRKVLKKDKLKLVALGKLLAANTENVIFRSGNASGTDQLFSQGVASVNNQRLQVITPYSGHRKKTNKAAETVSLDEIDLSNEQEVLEKSKSNKTMERLIDGYVSGTKNRNTIKAAYIIRDTIKVIGTNELKPTTFGIFYDDLENPMQGGTGHTMNMCSQNNTPYINQTKWFKWLE